MSRKLRWRLILGLAIVVVAFVAWPAATASADNLLVTGHDVDDHCEEPGDTDQEPEENQCGYMQVATSFVRAGAPVPSRKVLLLQCTAGNGEDSLVGALDSAFGTGVVPRDVVCPSDPADNFASVPLNTSTYSAVILGSSCDEDEGSLNSQVVEDVEEGDNDLLCNNEPDDENPPETRDSDAINARKADFTTFFNAGGGIFAMAGDDNGDGDPTSGPDSYYDFLPLPAEGAQVAPPFCLTQVGKDLGLQDPVDGSGLLGTCPDPTRRNGTRDDINCCETHNSFAVPPAGSPLRIAEEDLGDDGEISGDDLPETLVCEGCRIGGGGFEPPPQTRSGCGGEKPTIVGHWYPETLIGTSGDDVIVGKGGRDLIDGLAGDDIICAGAANDRIWGGPGDDDIFGASGNDAIFGNGDDDRLFGTSGNDDIFGNGGDDTLHGQGGNDDLFGGPDSDTLLGGGGRNRLQQE